MTLQLDQVALDARDPERVAKFWAEVLDYKVSYDSATDPDNDSPEREIELSPKNGSTTMLLILENYDEKNVKNRLHFDLRPDDQEAEVARVEALGAKRVDIGQGDVTWVVLADPEGNEFCILRSKESSD
jgi:predicted enzyme related to lactoylglutathione lyase